MVKFRCDVMAESKDDHPKENLTLFVENLPIKEDKLDDDSELYDFTNHLDYRLHFMCVPFQYEFRSDAYRLRYIENFKR